MTSSEYIKGNVAICTTKGLEDPVYKLIHNVSNLNIKMVENYGQTGTFQIINIFDDPTVNLLSPSCTGWSDGVARKIDPTMFVRIFSGKWPNVNPIGVFKITTISASAETLTVEFCDSLQYLRSQGADYVYNHYQGGYVWHNDKKLIWNNDKAYIKKPANLPISGGARKDVKVTYIADRNSMAENGNTMSVNWQVSSFIPRSAYTGDYLKSLKNINFSGLAITVEDFWVRVGHTEGGSDILNDNFRENSNFDRHYTFDLTSDPSKYYVPNGFWVTIGTRHVLNITTKQSDVPGAKSKWGEDQSHWTDNVSIRINITTEKETDNVTGAEDTTDYSKWVVNTADGIPIDQNRVDSWTGSAKLYYPEASGNTPNTTIMHDILGAFDMELDTPQRLGSRGVGVFHCNGDMAHNYLLTLADMPTDDNRQFVLYSDMWNWDRISVRERFRTDTSPDTSLKALAYSKDNVSGATVFEKFNPSISLKNHPRMAVVKSSDESGHSIMVAVEDLNIAMGSTDPIVSSSSSDVVTAALEAYSAIITNRSNKWGGEIVVPYIVSDFFKRSSDTLCGGIPITITDSRYGFHAMLVKVKEVKWDFANQTTTITVNNYSETYSNGLVDTTKMAYTSGGLSAEATSIDMFTRQFVNVRSASNYPDRVTVKLIDRVGNVIGESDPSNVKIVKIPELGIGVINTYFPYGQGTTTERHGIYAIRINDTDDISINQYKRPDKSASESLIVNVIYRLS